VILPRNSCGGYDKRSIHAPLFYDEREGGIQTSVATRPNFLMPMLRLGKAYSVSHLCPGLTEENF